ncbi:MAG: toll/interleukin-1 receptor domain-containing protein [Bacteroidales bacterium]|jgi:hypothetical protein|nr:toll/interleukin-1 receptor domain-containing protein [Bacteroidales bacterium]
MAKVFLSHSSVDKPFVRKIKKILYPFGTYSWLDEQEIFPGDKLWETILKGIDSSDKAIVFVTSNSQDSDWVQKEVKEFIVKEESENQSKVIPVIFTPNPPEFLTERLYINFDSRPISNCIKDLLIGINRNKSVLVIEPLKNEPYKLDSFKEELTSHKKSAETGDLIFVYDYYSLLDNI